MARHLWMTDDRSAGTGTQSSITRRRCLGSIVATGLAAGGLVGAAATTAAAYEELALEAGERRTISLESSETFENTLIDCTADGAHVTIVAHGTDWTVRNVGIEGAVAGGEAVFGVSDSGDGSTIENVYVGDGAEPGHRNGLGIWIAPQHEGHIDIERVNVQEMGDNSFYCSAPGGSGTVDLRHCYSANSWVAHYRLARGTVENCTALNDERREDGRGIWAWAPGPVEVRDCNLVMNGRQYAFDVGANNQASTVEVTDTEWDDSYNGGTTENGELEFESGNGTDPEDVVPEGCPESALDAVEDAEES